MRGYKAFNPDMTCMGFQYEEGKEYVHNGDIKLCESGFHFCTNASDCFSYYDFDPENIVCRVESLGITKTNECSGPKILKDKDECFEDLAEQINKLQAENTRLKKENEQLQSVIDEDNRLKTRMGCIEKVMVGERYTSSELEQAREETKIYKETLGDAIDYIQKLAAERDRYKEALKKILITPSNNSAYDPEGVAREALDLILNDKPTRTAEGVLTKPKDIARHAIQKVRDAREC